MAARAMNRLVAWLIAHGGRVVGSVLLVSLGLGVEAARLRLEFRAGDLLPQGHPFIAVHNRYHRNFSEANVLSVMLEARSGTIFTPPILATIHRAPEAVDALPGVNHDQVTSVAHRSTRWARVRPGGMIASEPIILRPPQQEAEAAEIRREVLQSYAFYDEILRSQARMTVASFLVIVLVLVPTYRAVTAAVLLIIPLALASVVVNAYMAARGIGLDLNTLPVIGVAVGFGIDYGIYVLSRVGEAVRAGATLEAATHEALRHAGRTVAFTAVTMTAGMLCFTATSLRFVGEMAALLALWMGR